MATELGECVEDTTRDNTRTITGDENYLTSEAIERKKKSVIWMFFSVDKEDKSKAICLTCKEKVSRGGSNPKNFNTTNLRKHLQSHRDKYKEFCEKETAKRDETQERAAAASALQTSEQASLKQSTLEGLAERKKPLSPDHPRAKELTYRLAVMIAIDLQPFSIEDVGFCQLVAALEPRFSLPSRRYLSEVVIPEIHAKVKHGITELLQSAKYISLTTDIWTSTICHHIHQPNNRYMDKY